MDRSFKGVAFLGLARDSDADLAINRNRSSRLPMDRGASFFALWYSAALRS
jgi:hypothetical protein